MNKKRFSFIFAIIIMASSFSSYAQSNQEVQLQINEIMKAREEMIKSLLNDSAFENFDKKFEDLIKKMDKENFSSGAESDASEVIGEYDWRETPTHQIFVLKIKQIKNKPLDIKIEKGQIKLKGDVESVDIKNPKSRRSTKVHFERTFAIPQEVDQSNPEFENKSGELLIKFKKLKTAKAPPKTKSIKPVDQRRPVGKDADDLTI